MDHSLGELDLKVLEAQIETVKHILCEHVAQIDDTSDTTIQESIKKKLESWKTVRVDIAVIGCSGVGKSSFINAIRRLKPDEDGAAEVDVKECTLRIQNFAYPNKELIQLWDLPGVGTDQFPRKSYLEAIEFDRYDFYLLLSAGRFTENDTWLGQEITKRDKNFFFVRTKIDVDIASDKRAHPETWNEEKLLERIRSMTAKSLVGTGIVESECNKRVFLIDNYDSMQFDFNELELAIIDGVSNEKRKTLILSVAASTKEVLELKVSELKSRIWSVVLNSVMIGCVPQLGDSVKFDPDILQLEIEMYFKQLGLDDKSLQTLAALTSSKFDDLKSVVVSRCGPDFLSDANIKAMIADYRPISMTYATEVVEKAEKAGALVHRIFGTVAVRAGLVAANVGLSALGTSRFLADVLTKLETVSIAVIEHAAKSTLGSMPETIIRFDE